MTETDRRLLLPRSTLGEVADVLRRLASLSSGRDPLGERRQASRSDRRQKTRRTEFAAGICEGFSLQTKRRQLAVRLPMLEGPQTHAGRSSSEACPRRIGAETDRQANLGFGYSPTRRRSR